MLTKGKQSFFEKKDQKTFTYWSVIAIIKVFCFFFSKKKALSFLVGDGARPSASTKLWVPAVCTPA
jgi:hypothetical protein